MGLCSGGSYTFTKPFRKRQRPCLKRNDGEQRMSADSGTP